MVNPIAWLSNKLRRMILTIFAVLSTACHPGPPSVPIEKSIQLGRGGEVLEFDFRVKEHHEYIVELRIFFHRSDDVADRNLLVKQLGDTLLPDGTTRDVGVPISLRVHVKSLEPMEEALDFDQVIDETGFTGATKYYASKRVTSMRNKKLFPGVYRIRLENLHSVPQFADRVMAISIHRAYKGK